MRKSHQNSIGSKKNLNWEPTYNIKKSVQMTTNWYLRVIQNKENPMEVTSDQIDKYMYDSK